jgi:hypothetical protein
MRSFPLLHDAQLKGTPWPGRLLYVTYSFGSRALAAVRAEVSLQSSPRQLGREADRVNRRSDSRVPNINREDDTAWQKIGRYLVVQAVLAGSAQLKGTPWPGRLLYVTYSFGSRAVTYIADAVLDRGPIGED